MTSPVPILMASPREPSGSSWIINCLLELGVKVCLQPTIDRIWGPDSGRAPGEMWQRAGDGWQLHRRAQALKKLLPVLWRETPLTFREDVEVLYVQELPERGLYAERTILFIRDLRDSLNSLYRRLQPAMSLRDFVRVPHPATLLDAVDHWRLFVECWLNRPDLLVYRFEDYKQNAQVLLTRILADLEITASAEEIARAAAASTFEQARAAEARYKQLYPGDAQTVVRAGQVAEWESLPELAPVIADIEHRAGPLLTRLGYTVPSPMQDAAPVAGYATLPYLSHFDQVDLPDNLGSATPDMSPVDHGKLAPLLQLAAELDPPRLEAFRLEAAEIRTLLGSLEEFVQRYAARLVSQIQHCRTEFAPGSAYHMDRLRTLMASHRRADSSD